MIPNCRFRINFKLFSLFDRTPSRSINFPCLAR